jgi:RimJ/RimL family protein N-acetyltransferase
MRSITIREPQLSDESAFLDAMQHSKNLHHPWVKAPLTSQEFQEYLARCSQQNQKSYLVITNDQNIAGVYNISEIVRGLFQSAYLGFYAVAGYTGKGYMSSGLKLTLNQVFTTLGLHRLEANIQPRNINSINLVKANGFKKEGYSPRYLKITGVWCDHERWAITYEDWIVINKGTFNE